MKPVESSAKTKARSAITILPKRDISQKIVSHPGNKHQKTSNSLGNFCVNDKSYQKSYLRAYFLYSIVDLIQKRLRKYASINQLK